MDKNLINKKRIFTFWEPKGKIPGYLELCLDTWKKYLPEYEIIILDYDNLNDWIGKNYYNKVLYEKFSLPIQADAIRCAVLCKYGGVWMDIDTVVTSDNIKQLMNFNTQLTLINNHIAFIVAKKEGKIIKHWLKRILLNIKIANFYYNPNSYLITKYMLKRFFSKHFLTWDCMGNRILKKLLKTKNKALFYKINSDEILCFPEIKYKLSNNLNTPAPENYAKFYFEKDYSDFALKDNEGIILLHNSWTPEKYKQMTKEEFLATNNTLSNILQKIL